MTKSPASSAAKPAPSKFASITRCNNFAKSTSHSKIIPRLKRKTRAAHQQIPCLQPGGSNEQHELPAARRIASRLSARRALSRADRRSRTALRTLRRLRARHRDVEKASAAAPRNAQRRVAPAFRRDDAGLLNNRRRNRRLSPCSCERERCPATASRRKAILEFHRVVPLPVRRRRLERRSAPDRPLRRHPPPHPHHDRAERRNRLSPRRCHQ